MSERSQHGIENTAALKWEMQWHQFKEINWVFNTDNFDSRQQFSLAQQFAMQNKLLPPLPRREIQYQRGRAKLRRVDLLRHSFLQSWVSSKALRQYRTGLETVCENLGKEEGEEKRGFNPLSGEWPPTLSPHLWKIQSSSDQPTPPRFRALQLRISPSPENDMACGALQQDY